MLVNQDTAISTSRILLVPYEPHHVPTYHEWMQDEEIRTLTASEPLSLEEENAMQRTWRSDPDKLTFIACLPLTITPPSEPNSIEAHIHDAPELLLGDVNLFLTPADEDPEEGCIGELELMIAPAEQRRKGFGRAAVLAFMHYISVHMDEIMAEYAGSVSPSGAESNEDVPRKMRLLQLRVKIGSKNLGSIALFESLGFVQVGEGENYFGEVELVFEGFLGVERTRELMRRGNLQDYTEHIFHRKS